MPWCRRRVAARETSNSSRSSSPEHLVEVEQDWQVVSPARREMGTPQAKSQACSKGAPKPKPKAAATSSYDPEVPINDARLEKFFGNSELRSDGYRYRVAYGHPCKVYTVGQGKRLHVDCNILLSAQTKHPGRVRQYQTCPCINHIMMLNELVIDEREVVHSAQICPDISGVQVRKISPCQICLERGAPELQ